MEDLSFTSTVVSCIKVENGKKKTKGSSAELGEVFSVVLLKTLFRPEDGGQLEDKGTLDGIAVEAIKKRVDGNIEHLLRLPSKWEEGKVVIGVVNGKIRFDHSQQHSAQHLISAISMDHFNLQTVSWQMTEAGPCSVDLSLIKPKTLHENEKSSQNSENSSQEINNSSEKLVVSSLSASSSTCPDCPSSSRVASSDLSMQLDSTISMLDDLCNKAILNNNPVIIHKITRAQYNDPSSLEFTIRSRGIPDGVSDVQIVEIKDIDASTCCGTHVSSLSQLRMIKFIKIDHVKSGVQRLWFLSGERLNQEVTFMIKRERTLTSLLSGPPPEHEKLISLLQEKESNTRKEKKRIEEEYAEVLAERMINEASNRSHLSNCIEKEQNHDEEQNAKESIEEKDVHLMPVHLHLDRVPSTIVPLIQHFVKEKSTNLRYIITYTPLCPSNPALPHSGNFFVSTTDSSPKAKDWVAIMGKRVCAIVEGKGGGKDGQFSGKGNNLRESDRVKDEIIEVEKAIVF
ncbi:putative alanyl-tRNA synthetase [Monocercomonoides exilis]|uniref:putative alanyl-tRNA synthetase n=1 Tax=Monocercomonoides exilis TaxID=2049356 RepID=UPI00355A72C9|nr:putative alanyl-tRNA synthetase [Monocercomonoides exilis]|eukprot:MONOS_12936.1-p1 / transcript=MONOS_12936.1 / gene=MONOS_12936 / organism=Monocercomonoides_exilis_PA203 / gene_product=alanyl-tRNA synthetase / transcript_product=alanyl-tRNA synthetase / location=Mono_scaffold00756:946-2863(-) / protein_length=513 / sequence_SO=supercontig / SO=protein_coding / is_pseudo=false